MEHQILEISCWCRSPNWIYSKSYNFHTDITVVMDNFYEVYFTFVPTKSNSDVIFCIHFLSKTFLYNPLEPMWIDISLVG